MKNSFYFRAYDDSNHLAFRTESGKAAVIKLNELAEKGHKQVITITVESGKTLLFQGVVPVNEALKLVADVAGVDPTNPNPEKDRINSASVAFEMASLEDQLRTLQSHQ